MPTRKEISYDANIQVDTLSRTLADLANKGKLEPLSKFQIPYKIKE